MGFFHLGLVRSALGGIGKGLTFLFKSPPHESERVDYGEVLHDGRMCLFDDIARLRRGPEDGQEEGSSSMWNELRHDSSWTSMRRLTRRRVGSPSNTGDVLKAVLQILRPVPAFREALLELQCGNVPGNNAVSLRAMFEVGDRSSVDPAAVLEKLFSELTRCTARFNRTTLTEPLRATACKVERLFFCECCGHGIRPTYSNNIIKVAVPNPVPGPTSGSVGRYALVNLLSKGLFHGPSEYCGWCSQNETGGLMNIRWQYLRDAPSTLLFSLERSREQRNSQDAVKVIIPTILGMNRFTERRDPPGANCYDLVGVIHGQSSAASSDWVAYTRSPGGRWIRHNGQDEVDVNERDVLTNNAHILRYAKRGSV
ncbi:conserved unknown protein [Ectocarpus siliculosus]|uniref:USP domain-containing protein n=1 Tax=Ectocarpus siliculosus TaxID=2880 RepID=D7FIV9_ECTSI|nr:conserved unknown protein [Ectocarpus siliculosus]|eukprot:CBJ28943.1 conserved unknown protein [Ectocarpus siliculosus]